MKPTINQELNDRFFQQPEWEHVEKMIMAYVTPLIEMDSVDTSAPAEHVKAEVIGRKMAYDALTSFLRDTKFVSRKLPEQQGKNPFT